jgi:glycine oxidase
MKESSQSVVIVGAGIMGMLTALELSDAGVMVDLFDASRPGTESSWAGGGIVSPLYPWRYPAAVTALASWAQNFYPEFSRRLHELTNLDPEFDRWGLLMLDASDHEDALLWASKNRKTMIAKDGDFLRTLEPGATIGVGRLLHMPDVGAIRNPRLVRSILTLLAKSPRVRLHPDTCVSALHVQGSVIRGVCTHHGIHAADMTVLCSGAWTSRLMNDIDAQLPIKPVRGQMIAFRCRVPILRHILLRDGTYLIPRRGGVILAGSTLEFVGFDKSTTNEAREWLRSRAVSMLPALADADIVAHWAGLRPGSPEGIPWIGPWPGLDGLFINAGHYRNGLVLAPAAARLLADQLLGRPLSIMAPDCSPASRLESVHLSNDTEWLFQTS